MSSGHWLAFCGYVFGCSQTKFRLFFVFFFNDTATTEIYTLSLHDALPIYLDPVFLEFLRPTYEKMKIPNLLRRCLPGFSQNQNESLNSLVWVRAPKHKFHGKNVIETAAWSATLHFNNGASAREEVMLQASIPCGRHTVAGSDRKDKNRIIQSIKKATVKKKQRRLKIQLARSREEERRLDAEGTPSYLSGGFNDLETVVEPQSKRKRKN